MTEEERAICAEWSQAVQERVHRLLDGRKIPYTETGRQIVEGVIKELSRDFMNAHGNEMNTGITAEQYRKFDPLLDKAIPGDWELWCCGWRVTYSGEWLPGHGVKFYLEPIGRAFCPPT